MHQGMVRTPKNLIDTRKRLQGHHTLCIISIMKSIYIFFFLAVIFPIIISQAQTRVNIVACKKLKFYDLIFLYPYVPLCPCSHSQFALELIFFFFCSDIPTETCLVALQWKMSRKCVFSYNFCTFKLFAYISWDIFNNFIFRPFLQ